jgi:hypothetical protein
VSEPTPEPTEKRPELVIKVPWNVVTGSDEALERFIQQAAAKLRRTADRVQGTRRAPRERGEV